MKKILFVCLGNICRSPLAEGVTHAHLTELQLDIVVDSAGTSDWHEGEHPCGHSITVAKVHGVDISQQKSRPVCKEDIEISGFLAATISWGNRKMILRPYIGDTA